MVDVEVLPKRRPKKQLKKIDMNANLIAHLKEIQKNMELFSTDGYSSKDEAVI